MDIFTTFFNLAVLERSFPLLLSGLWITLELGVVSIVGGLIGGLVLALLRLYGHPVVQAIAKIYIDIFRSIPLLVLLIVIYYALPFVGIRLSPFLSAVSALTLVSTAYTAEIFRAGIEAIPRGQFEASEALGLSYRHMAAMQRLVDCRLAIGGPGDIGLRDGSTVLDLCCRGRCRR